MKANKPKFEHRIGSHSDDWGGDSDKRCDCQDTPNPTPTTLREVIDKLLTIGEVYTPEDVDQATQSIQEQLKALLPKKINAEMPNATTVAYNRCLSDVEKAIEEWAE